MNAPQTIAHIGWIASCHLKRRVGALAARGVKNVVFTDNVPDLFNPADHDFIVEQLPGPGTPPLERIEWLDERLAAHGADLLHAHSTHYPAALAYFVRSVPVINSVWDFVNSRDPFSPLFNHAILEELQAGRLADAVSFSSKSLMDDWAEDGFPKDRVFWHSWGVNFDLFQPGRYREEAAALRRRLGIGEDEILLLSPRTPSLPANNDLAMQAAALLRKKHPVRLVITGHHIPREFRYVERLARRRDIRDCVIFLETVREDMEIATLYEAADLVLSLHNNDFNPATVLESFAMKRAVVVNELKTVNWWVEDGVNGFTAPARDLQGTVEVLDTVVSLSADERNRLGEAGRKKVKKWGDFEKTMDSLPGDYARLLSLSAREEGGLSAYDLGLLHDICAAPDEAVRFYAEALDMREERSQLDGLYKEKQALLGTDKGVDFFCAHRCQRGVAAMTAAPETEWKRWMQLLPPAPMSLFRHDYCAALYPLLASGNTERLLRIIDALAARYHTDTLEWIGETVTLFGRRFAMWEECVPLLLSVTEGSPALAILCLEAARELGSDHLSHAALLSLAQAGASQRLDFLNPALDTEFCADVLEEITRQDAPSVFSDNHKTQ